MTEIMFPGVRFARQGDEKPLFDFLLLLYQENAMFPIAAEKVMSAIKVATEKKGGIIGIIDGDEGIEASCGLVVESWWYTNALCLDEKWNFVRQDRRKTGHARKLIEFSKWCSDRIGVPLHMGVISKDRTAAKVRLYRRQMPFLGGFFMHGIQMEEADNVNALIRDLSSGQPHAESRRRKKTAPNMNGHADGR